jgi:hypothetical protein
MNLRRPASTRSALEAAACLAAMLVWPLPSSADDCGAVRIVPPHAVVEGKTLGEWSVEWWRWALSIPLERNPINEGPCGEAQDFPVFFLAGNLAGSSKRTCTVPCGKPIFFPIINFIFTAPPECFDCASCRDLARSHAKTVFRLGCEIDGKALDEKTLLRHREMSPDCFDLEHVEIFYDPGRYEIAYADGYWIMLEPLCAGEEHTLVFRAGSGPSDCSEFCLDVSYTLKAAPYFRRGDTDGDGRVQITDPIRTLNALFTGGEAIGCEDAADANDDGTVNIADPVFTLNWLFLGGPPPPSPGPLRCGPDPTEDALEPCSSTPMCT